MCECGCFVVFLVIYWLLETHPLTHVYTHALHAYIMLPYMFTHVFMTVWLGLGAYWSTYVGLVVKSYLDTCMHSHGLQGLTNFNMYYTHLQDLH